ncbi:pilus assembly protein PilM [Massilia sp. H6]|uniref:pilus assembly protein PilM n=1 Tax=Massilia sp. H6 TaxID=2970464 RepID=UPI002167196F|nr:pilus assembly protein PilM [Massilia sp. H6]UVW28733.1 pilus assembly protein PilM [Massilia sp. H6]
MNMLRTLLTRTPARPAPIGVDFAAQRLNMLQVTASPDGPLLRAAVSRPYPVERGQLLADPRMLRSFVRDALASAPFAGRRMVSALAPGDVRILPLTVHVPSGQSEQGAVAKAVRDQLGAAAADSVVDYYQVRSVDSSGPERQVLAAVASTAGVLAYLDAMRGAGFDPVALDIGPAAIARLLAAMQEDVDQAVLLINFGVRKSFLTVIWGRRLMLDREIDFGEAQLVERLSRVLGLDADAALGLLHEHGIGIPAAALHVRGQDQQGIGRTIREILYQEFAAMAEELVRTQVYVASRTRGSALSRVYLNGSVARYANVCERIEELVNLPVEVLDPLRAFRPAAGFTINTDMQGIALAAGLALRRDVHG